MQLVPIGVAAQGLGVHPDTLRRLEKEGKIDPPKRTAGGRRPGRYRREGLMKRTVRLATLPLNPGKRAALRQVLGIYADAKGRFVTALRSPSMWHHLDNKRRFRDWAKERGLYPPGVPVHLVDQAAFEATEICARYIESVLTRAQVKARIWRRFTDEAERHYAYACLARYGALGAIMRGATPDLSAGDLCKDRRAAVTRYLHRILRKALREEEWPTVRGARSMSLDATLYSAFVKERPGKQPQHRQYVSVVGPRLRERIVIPLAGVSRTSGNIRVVLDEGEDRAFIHVAYEAKPLPGQACGPDKAIDWGLSEVCTDDAGVKHGVGYGRVLEKATEQRNATGKARGKLRALAGRCPDPKRASRIAKHNLGSKKQRRRGARTQAALQTIAGAAIKEVIYGEGNRTRAQGRVRQLPTQRPRRLVLEDLAHLRGKARSRKLSRLCTTWARTENQSRMTVHAYLGGSEVKTANAAYTSQTCPDPRCGYVSAENRSGDRFHCRNPHWDCNWQGDVDHVAAMNLLSRIDDPTIHRFTPHGEVKKVLEERFHRRLESRSATCDTASGVNMTRLTATAHGRTPSRPRRRMPDVGGGVAADSLSPVASGRSGIQLSGWRANTKGEPRNA